MMAKFEFARFSPLFSGLLTRREHHTGGNCRIRPEVSNLMKKKISADLEAGTSVRTAPIRTRKRSQELEPKFTGQSRMTFQTT